VTVDRTSSDGCQAALADAQARLTAVDDAQDALSAAVAIMTEAATTLAKQPSSSPSPTASAGGGGAGNGQPGSGSGGSGPGASGSSASGSGGSGTGSAGSGSGSESSGAGGGGQSTSVATATADVARAKLALTAAEVNLDHATLTAPISGTVASVPFIKGGSMSTSEAIEIVGTGAVLLTVDVPESSIRQIRIGQTAAVSPSPGVSFPAEVTAIGFLPSDATTSSTSYPVTVTLAAATVQKNAKALSDGVSATVKITTASAPDAVLVPVSAVTPTGDGTGTVTVITASGAASQRVELGVMSSTEVQVTGGLAAGATVALADRTAELPSSSSTSSNRRTNGSILTGGTGGFTGGGGFTGPR
jgi:multidrug efflux pump subunit AcrA (membrane-fusion protein)